MEPAQQNSKPKNLHCENESHSEKKSDLGSGNLQRSRKSSHRRGKIRRTVKSREISECLDKSKEAKLDMKNPDVISCGSSAKNGEANEDCNFNNDVV